MARPANIGLGTYDVHTSPVQFHVRRFKVHSIEGFSGQSETKNSFFVDFSLIFLLECVRHSLTYLKCSLSSETCFFSLFQKHGESPARKHDLLDIDQNQNMKT